MRQLIQGAFLSHQGYFVWQTQLLSYINAINTGVPEEYACFMASTDETKPFLYSVEKLYSFPVERLWRAWTDPNELEAWYHPTDLENISNSVVSELKLGGWWSVAVDASPYGFIAYFWGQYTDIKKHELLAHSMFYSQSKEDFLARDTSGENDTIVINFFPQDDSTLVRFSQYGSLAKNEVPEAKAGMESYFESLLNHLERF